MRIPNSCYTRPPYANPSVSERLFSYDCPETRTHMATPACLHFDFKRRKSNIAFSGQNTSNNVEMGRKIVEHLCIIKAKEGLSEEDEKDMLDYLYTSQYHMRGILAISLGRTSDQSPEKYSHAAFMRFQRKEDLEKFYKHPPYMRVLEEHVIPHCDELLYVDFESEVQDDMLLIFRKGEEFHYGVEFILLIAFIKSASIGPAEDALSSLEKVVMEFPTLIVQATQGCNFNQSYKDYTHGIVIRFRSVDAMEIFLESREYKNVWRSKFEPINQRTLCVHFLVDPVGKQIM